MKFKITGAYRNTGGDIEITVEAKDYLEAQDIARSLDILIASITPCNINNDSPQSNAIQFMPSFESSSSADLARVRNNKSVKKNTLRCRSCGVRIPLNTKKCLKCGIDKPIENDGFGVPIDELPDALPVLFVLGLIVTFVVVCCSGYCAEYNRWQPAFDGGYTAPQTQDLRTQHQQAIQKALEANSRGDYEAERRWGAEADKLADEIRKQEGSQ